MSFAVRRKDLFIQGVCVGSFRKMASDRRRLHPNRTIISAKVAKNARVKRTLNALWLEA
jgi:hypothetical protein